MKQTKDKYGNPILTGNSVYKPEAPEIVFTVNRALSLLRNGQIAFRQGEWFPSDYVVEGREPLETDKTADVAPVEPKVPVLTEEESADLHEEQQAEAPSEHERQMEFLKAIKELGSANKALKAVGINLSVVNIWKLKDKAFLARYNEVLAETGNLKYVNNRNAVHIGSIESFSDKALVDALRSRGWTVKCEKMVEL